jgi:hypothetical protein
MSNKRRFGLVADVHLGNHRKCGGQVYSSINTRCSRILVSLEKALTVAWDEGCEAVYVLGDFFDRADPIPQIVAEARSVLGACQFGLKAPHVELLLGNHDMHSDEECDNALWALKNHTQVVIVEKPHRVAHGFAVPFARKQASKYIPESLSSIYGYGPGSLKANHPVNLFLHAGIADNNTPPWLLKAYDAIHVDTLFKTMKDDGFLRAFAGNWHNPQHWRRDDMEIVQCGALVPTGWDNPGMDYGRLTIVEDGGDWFQVVIPGPRFLTAKTTRELMEQVAAAKVSNCHPYMRLICSPEDKPAFRSMTDRLVKENALGVDDFFFEDPPRTEAVEAAAKVASSTETLGASLAAFVDGMQVAVGVDKQAVLDEAKRYLGVSG